MHKVRNNINSAEGILCKHRAHDTKKAVNSIAEGKWGVQNIKTKHDIGLQRTNYLKTDMQITILIPNFLALWLQLTVTLFLAAWSVTLDFSF